MGESAAAPQLDPADSGDDEPFLGLAWAEAIEPRRVVEGLRVLEDRTRTGMATESTHRIHVYRRRRWPARFFVVLYALDGPLVVATVPSIDKARGAVLFGTALVLSLVWLYASERRAIHVQFERVLQIAHSPQFPISPIDFGRACCVSSLAVRMMLLDQAPVSLLDLG